MYLPSGGQTASRALLTGGRGLRILARHLDELRLLGQSEGTIYARRRAILRMASLIGTPLLEATPEDLRAWRAGLRVTENTVTQYASHARQFFGWAVEAGLMERNPAAGLLGPVLSRGLPRPIGEDPLFAAVAAAPARIRPWLVLAGWAGLRAKEIAYLRRERVLDSADPPVLLIARDATKGNRERVVPMCAFLVDELRVYGLPRAGWVFPRLDGQPGPNPPSPISHAAHAHLRSIRLSETLQQFRHRFGTQTLWAKKDLRVVQELLGHARPETTALYTAYNQVAAIEAVEALPAPWGRFPCLAD